VLNDIIDSKKNFKMEVRDPALLNTLLELGSKHSLQVVHTVLKDLDNDELSSMIEVVQEHIPHLCKIIDYEPVETRNYQYGNTIKPFGL